jgi:sugar lactone lactonase YvrE
MAVCGLLFTLGPASAVAFTTTPAAAAGSLSAVTATGGQGNGTGANQLTNPTQVALDSQGDLFVLDNADSFGASSVIGDRVVEYPLSATTGTYAATGTIVEGLANLINPTGIALDSSGDLFVSDGVNNRVLEFPVAANGTYPTTGVTVAGTGGEGSGATQLDGPTNLAVSTSGNLFVADSGNNRVQELVRGSSGSYAASGITVAGTGVSGTGSTQLSDPGSLVFDSLGDLFVADNGNHRIQEFAFNTTTGAFAASAVTAFTLSGTPVIFGQLAFNPSGDLFTTWTYPTAESVVELAPNANGTYSTVSVTIPWENQTVGIAADSHGNLFLSEGDLTFEPASQPANLVQEFSPTSTSGVYSSTVSLSAVQGTGVSPLSEPDDVAVDGHGNLYVADPGKNAVIEFPLNTATGAYAATGTVIAGAGGTGSGANQLSDPDAVALDSHGNLFVSDSGNNRVVEYTLSASTGAYSAGGTTVAGAGGKGSGSKQFNGPGPMALDAQGDLFVADQGNSRVVEYPFNATTGSYASSGATLASGIESPSIALGSTGNLYVGNPSNNDILEYPLNTATGTYSTTGSVVARTGASGSTAIAAGPGSLAVDSQGDIFTGGGYFVYNVTEFPFNSTTGQYPSSPTVLLGQGTGPTGVSAVWGMTIDTHGDLFIADTLNQRIQELAGVAAPSSSSPPPAPTVTGITPTAGPAAGGTGVTITGTNLSGGSVSFSSTAATGVSCGPSSCSATSPAGSGTVNVTVTTTGGTSATSTADQFTYQPAPPSPPTITSINPTSGTTAGGTSVTIAGTNLASASAVDFGTAAATVTADSASSITATTPAGSAGAVSVSVTTPNGTSTDTSAYTYVAPAPPPSPPTITSINPTSGTTAGGTSVTIAGTNLASASAVDFGTAAATVTADSASSITATTPAGSAGVVAVSVTTPGGTVTDTSAYTYVAPTSTNLIPDPGFQTTAVPADNWGSTLARSQAQVYASTWSLAQTTTSSSGGWDLDSNLTWCAPISSTKTYTASIWVRSSAAVTVDLNLDLLTSAGSYVNSANGPNVALVANTWTELSMTGIKVTSTEVLGGMEPNFSKATKGTVIYWDDMSLTIP